MASKRLGAVLALSLLFSIPVTAQADTYATGSESQDFVSSPGGWTHTTAHEGLCAQFLACPTVVNTWAGAGGADGNGYIRTQLATFPTTLAGTSTGTWESPSFAYDGNAGKVPATANLHLNIRPQINALLSASVLNESTYRVDVVDQGTGTAINAIPQTELTSDAGWTGYTGSVNPDLLKVGHNYKIRVTTRYYAQAATTATGEVGYDNVRLSTAGKGDGANGGSGITTRKELRKLVKTYILPSSAKLIGDKLKMKLRCPAIAAPKPCKIQVQGLAKGKFSVPATARKFVTVKPGKTRIVKIRVKPRYLATYKAATKIWVKSTVRVGSIRVTVRKRLKLLH